MDVPIYRIFFDFPYMLLGGAADVALMTVQVGASIAVYVCVAVGVWHVVMGRKSDGRL